MVIKENQILIPTSLRSDILKDLHIPHLGIVKTKLLAKTCVYWPKTKDIQDLTEECSECQTHQRRQRPDRFRSTLNYPAKPDIRRDNVAIRESPSITLSHTSDHHVIGAHPTALTYDMRNSTSPKLRIPHDKTQS